MEFKPRDPIERMLLSQIIWTQSRLAYLTALAHQQKNIKWASVLHEATDRAANTFRRQVLALAEYRRPPRPRSFTAIGQANIAQQQLIQNGKSENGNTTNEQGSAVPKALPTHAGGTGIPSGVGAPREAVAIEHRAEDAGGQDDVSDERAAAR